MIDKIYIDSAVNLRREYLNLNSNLKNYESMILSLKNKVEETILNLQNIVDNIDKTTTQEVQKKSMKYLMSLEEETQKIQRFVDPINKKLESLQREEQALYNQIKISYPGLRDGEILSYIQDELKKRNLS